MGVSFAGKFLGQEGWYLEIFAIIPFRIYYYFHQQLSSRSLFEETTFDLKLLLGNFEELQVDFLSFLFNILSGYLLNLRKNLCQILAGFDYFQISAISAAIQSDNLTNFA